MRREAVETNYERNGSEGSRLCRARNGDAASGGLDWREA